MNATQRQARARIAGLTNSANGTVNTGPATRAAEARYERAVREEAAAHGEQLTEAETLRRAAAKRRLFFARLTYRSAQVRAARKGRQIEPQVEAPDDERYSDGWVEWTIRKIGPAAEDR